MDCLATLFLFSTLVGPQTEHVQLLLFRNVASVLVEQHKHNVAKLQSRDVLPLMVPSL